MAQEKIDRINEILSYVKEKSHFIVYCGDGKLYDNNNEEIRHIMNMSVKPSSAVRNTAVRSTLISR